MLLYVTHTGTHMHTVQKKISKINITVFSAVMSQLEGYRVFLHLSRSFLMKW